MSLVGTTASCYRKSLQRHKNRIEEFFEMGCDLCDFQVTSLEHAKLHYLEEHSIKDGYLKCSCSDIKFKTNNGIYDHIEFHLGNNPDRYRFAYVKLWMKKLIPFIQCISRLFLLWFYIFTLQQMPFVRKGFCSAVRFKVWKIDSFSYIIFVFEFLQNGYLHFLFEQSTFNLSSECNWKAIRMLLR